MIRIATLTDLVVPVGADTPQKTMAPAIVNEPIKADEKAVTVMVVDTSEIDAHIKAERQKMAAKVLLGAAAIGCVFIILK